jgi:hypothetical protein
MAVGLYCPDCGEYYGKDTENFKIVDCGNCGERFYNPRGQTPDEGWSDEEREWLRMNKPRMGKYI